jgi:DNA-binding response OmpR family regulator
MAELRRLLLVDDEENFLVSLQEGLARQGFAVSTASNGEEALGVLARQPIDLVVTDLKMPGIDGFGLLAAMHSRYPTIPAIVMTAFATEAVELRSLEAGAIQCLDKPIDLTSLTQHIHHTLEQAALGRLRGVSLSSFLQLLGMERKTALVVVRWRDGMTRLYVKDGVLVHAEDAGQEGLEVALRAVALTQVEIEIRQGPAPSRPSLSLPITELLLESARLGDERGRELSLDDLDSMFMELQEVPPARAASPASVSAAPPSALGLDPPPSAQGGLGLNATPALESVMRIDGAIGVAVVDHRTGLTLAMRGGNSALNIEVAAIANTEVVRAELRTIQRLGLGDRIEDILITLAGQYHLIRILERHPHLFVYLALSRAQANLAMARLKLMEFEQTSNAR